MRAHCTTHCPFLSSPLLSSPLLSPPLLSLLIDPIQLFPDCSASDVLLVEHTHSSRTSKAPVFVLASAASSGGCCCLFLLLSMNSSHHSSSTALTSLPPLHLVHQDVRWALSVIPSNESTARYESKRADGGIEGRKKGNCDKAADGGSEGEGDRGGAERPER
ncbi:unnamed protein product [Pleuronectes platessa]|uniref:Uncharacterized protein n=1 Tax=Pleuronectes platessa TaxID=8262 RepID=A0A9N7ULT7_PLEPL|nr:unnamed protein product [Pleuronectes platessa]